MNNSKFPLLTPVIVDSPFYEGPAIVIGHADDGYYVKTEASEGYVSTSGPAAKSVRRNEGAIVDRVFSKYIDPLR